MLLLGFTIFIGASSRLLDLIFGLDRILRFHKKIAILSFSILLFHPMLISLANILEGINLIEFYISYLSYLPFVLGIISFSIFGLSVILTYFFFRVINHFVWLAFHRFAIVAFIFSCIHQYNLGVLSGPYSTTPAINIIIYLSILLVISAAIIRIILFFTKKKTLSIITDIVKETSDVHTIYIKKSENFKFKAGQFCFISFPIKGMIKPHPFTISSSPNDNYLSFTIKSQGKFTAKISSLTKGDKIKIDGPYGIFTYKNQKSVFIAGGVGITPFKSILSNMDKIESKNNLLLYANRKKKDIIFYNYFEKLKNSLPLKIIHILSQESIDGFEHGFVSFDLLNKHVMFDENFYLCGPPPMRKALIRILKKNKVPNKNIYFEKFFY